MIKVRRGCFETNSSSTHAICIPDVSSYVPRHVDFGIGEYGWSTDDAAPEDYLYTAILCVYGDTDEQLKEKLDQLKQILNDNGISYRFAEPEWYEGNKYRWLDNGSIDHSDETQELIDDLLADEQLLLRYLAGAEICTGNDNCEYSKASELYDEKVAAGWRCYWKGN